MRDKDGEQARVGNKQVDGVEKLERTRSSLYSLGGGGSLDQPNQISKT